MSPDLDLTVSTRAALRVNTDRITEIDPPFVHRVRPALLQPVAYDGLARVGGPNDGGYVVPVEALRRASALLSFGLDTDWSFEKGAAALNPELTIDVYDHTVTRSMFLTRWRRSAVSAPLRLLSFSLDGARSSWRRASIARDYLRFFTGRRRHHEQRIWYNGDNGSADIARVVDSAARGRELSIFAKIDVEGTEYRLIPAVCARAPLFTGLVIEFHDTDICAALFNEQLEALRESFEVVHVHGNNFSDLSVDRALPLCLEVTFLNKQLMRDKPVPYTGPLPRPALDAPNDPERADYVLNLRDAG